MSSETITRNDLEAILNNIYPSPASTITSADITSWNNKVSLSDIVVEEYSYNFGNIASGGTMTWTETVTKSGYYPIGLVGWRIARNTLVAYSARITDRASGTCGLELSARAVAAANASAAYMYVLWIKE